jgi:hypothetical protein
MPPPRLSSDTVAPWLITPPRQGLHHHLGVGDERFGAEDLRPDVGVGADQVEVRRCDDGGGGPVGQAEREGEPELGVVVPGPHVLVGVGVDPRRDPDPHRDGAARRADPFQPFDLLEAVEHDAGHTEVHGHLEFRHRLVVAVEDHPVHRERRRPAPCAARRRRRRRATGPPRRRSAGSPPCTMPWRRRRRPLRRRPPGRSGTASAGRPRRPPTAGCRALRPAPRPTRRRWSGRRRRRVRPSGARVRCARHIRSGRGHPQHPSALASTCLAATASQ